MFETRQLPAERDTVAPDGSDVRILLACPRGSMAHFELASNRTSKPVRHRTVEEIWYFLSGRGEMWRKCTDVDDIVAVHAGTCVTIPVGTSFQFRSTGDGPLTAIGVTMPPWPGDGEAEPVSGKWET